MRLILTLLAHLTRSLFRGQAENAVTECLWHILETSPACADALTALSNELGAPAPGALRFAVQAQTGDGGFFDLVGQDALGDVRLVIEAKFWAGLTERQPVGYLEHLPDRSLLLFVAPARRLAALWPELLDRCQALSPIPLPHADLSAIRLAQGPVMAVISWSGLIARFKQAATTAGDSTTLANLAQIDALAGVEDADAFIPLSALEITDQGCARRVGDYLTLARAISDKAIAAGVVGTDNNKLRDSGHGWRWVGRYLRVGDFGAWFGFWPAPWASLGRSPLWLSFGFDQYGCGRQVEHCLSDWKTTAPPRLYVAETVLLPVLLRANVTQDAVIADAVAQIAEVAERLRMGA